MSYSHARGNQITNLPEVGYIRVNQLIPGIIPVSRATLYRMIKRGDFPAPKKISLNISGWDVQVIRDFFKSNQAGDNGQ